LLARAIGYYEVPVRVATQDHETIPISSRRTRRRKLELDEEECSDSGGGGNACCTTNGRSMHQLQGLGLHVASGGLSQAIDAAVPAAPYLQNLSRVEDAAPVEAFPVTTTMTSTHDSTFSFTSSPATCSDLRSSDDICCDEDCNSSDETLRSGGHSQQVSYEEGLPITKITNWSGKAKMRKYVLAMPELPPPRQSGSSSPASVRLSSWQSESSSSGGGFHSVNRADSHPASHLESWNDTLPPTSAAGNNGLLRSAVEIFGVGFYSFGFGSFSKSFW